MNRFASITLALSSLLTGASAFAPAPQTKASTKLFSDVSDDIWDPLMLSQLGKNIDTFPNMFPDQQFVAEAEIKHGRMSMLAWTGIWATHVVSGIALVPMITFYFPSHVPTF